MSSESPPGSTPLDSASMLGPSSEPMSSTQMSWAQVLSALLRREDLDREAAEWAMTQIMSGEAMPAQIGGFLIGLRSKGETAGEIDALVDVMLSHAVRVEVRGVAVDVVGTGGDGAHTVNISTMAAVIAAAAGARVVKHGNRAASSTTGTADLLEHLGVAIGLESDGIVECLDLAGIAFCFAPTFHPAMRFAGPTRRELGVPTVFNVLGPLANPAQPAAQLIGAADARLAPVMADVLAARGVAAIVARGEDGLDELTTLSATRVWETTSGQAVESLIDAADLGIRRPATNALRGGDADFNAEVATQVLAAVRSATLDPVRDAVALNSAAAIVAHDSAAQKAQEPCVVPNQRIDAPLIARLSDALAVAYEALDSGAAAEKLRTWVSVSSALAAARRPSH
jgi:anthranilate phosphoribosyltransferase